MQTTNEQNPEPSKAPEEQASGQAVPAAVQPEADRKADDRSTPSAKGHRRHGKGQGRREQAKPLPQGALQDAIRGAAGDWKAFRNEQTALGRSQKTFWLTEEEAWRVRNYIRKIREKAEKHQKLLAEQARGKAEREKQALEKSLEQAMAAPKQEPEEPASEQ